MDKSSGNGNSKPSGAKEISATNKMKEINKQLLKRRIEPGEESAYIEIPFDVPAGVDRIEVSYRVLASPDPNGSEGGMSVIDLGVRDSRRMRGWSGGARDRFFIEKDAATPGYLHGPLEAGEWSVVLGAHRVAPSGCSVELNILLLVERPRWMCGDLHLHTVHSDGTFTIPETIEAALAAGLDYIALTDHNTSSQNQYAGRSGSLLLIPGMELTTGSGHCNLYGAADPLPDFRSSSPEQLRQRLSEAKNAGAYVSLNHPHCPNCGWLWGFDMEHDWVEIWNGPWREANQQTLSWWQEQLAAGRRITAVAGSDTHRPHPLVRHGFPSSWVYADRFDADGILGAIEKGRVSLSASPDGPFAELLCGETLMGGTVSKENGNRTLQLDLYAKRLLAGDEIRLWSDFGCERSVSVIRDGDLKLEWPVGNRRFWRAEIRRRSDSSDAVLEAATNPIYFQ